MVLVPIWAFLVLAERPTPQTVLGGTIILGAVIGKAILDGRTDATGKSQLATVPI
jgi:drug/metabolite transporter (DMT)-like permease